MKPHTHSYAHINESAYHAIRHALGLSVPLKRDEGGRFISRVESMSKALRAELAASNNASLAEAIEKQRGAA